MKYLRKRMSCLRYDHIMDIGTQKTNEIQYQESPWQSGLIQKQSISMNVRYTQSHAIIGDRAEGRFYFNAWKMIRRNQAHHSSLEHSSQSLRQQRF
mmetsp:Transcript_37711/g.79513  ORF Transcript_37711/g.79513 Transcript_37711/m.79513 type:complete len:96 (-) Transcript_37711:477-764(-)